MSYDRKKRFVLGFLAFGHWHHGAEIIEASRGQLLRSTAYKTFERMEREKLIKSKYAGPNIPTAEMMYRKI